MGFLSGIAKIAAPVVGSLIGSKMDNDAASSAASQANAFTKDQLQNRHQWEVADLRKAGLNPILSAHGNPSIGSSAKAEVFPRTKAVAEGVSSASTAALQRTQIENVKADTILKAAQAGSAEAATNLANTHSAASLQQQGIKRPLAGIADWGDRIVRAGSKNVNDLHGLVSGRKKWVRDKDYSPVGNVWKRLTN